MNGGARHAGGGVVGIHTQKLVERHLSLVAAGMRVLRHPDPHHGVTDA